MFYSALKNTWFDPSSRAEYEASGCWPDDAVEYPNAVFEAIVCRPPAGMVMVPDENGHPSLIERPRPAITKESLIAAVADKRWQVETGGLSVGGADIKTDRESRAQLSNTCSSLADGLIPNTPWKTASGEFIEVTLAEIEPVAQAVEVFVRACFAAEKAHCEAIDALVEQSEIDAYDVNAGWPK